MSIKPDSISSSEPSSKSRLKLFPNSSSRKLKPSSNDSEDDLSSLRDKDHQGKEPSLQDLKQNSIKQHFEPNSSKFNKSTRYHKSPYPFARPKSPFQFKTDSYLIEEKPVIEKRALSTPFDRKKTHTGTLQKTKSGLVYLKVEDELVENIYHLIEPLGAKLPYEFGHLNFIGAHIPVISEEEFLKTLPQSNLIDLGRSFHFTLCNIYSLKLDDGDLADTIWAFSVCCKELEHLRESLRLPSKLCSQDFMILLGVKSKCLTSEDSKVNNSDGSYYKTNPSYFPV